MSHFEYAIEVILEHEGGFVNDAHDPGGATNFGLSLRWMRKAGELAPEVLDLLDVDDDGVLTVDDVRGVTPKVARLMYRDFFWLPAYEDIRSRDVATKVADLGVNMGTVQAARIAQRAARAHGFKLVDDGVIGPRTLNAWNAVGVRLLFTLREAYAGFHRALVIRNDALIAEGVDVVDLYRFLAGWLNRDYS